MRLLSNVQRSFCVVIYEGTSISPGFLALIRFVVNKQRGKQQRYPKQHKAKPGKLTRHTPACYNKDETGEEERRDEDKSQQSVIFPKLH